MTDSLRMALGVTLAATFVALSPGADMLGRPADANARHLGSPSRINSFPSPGQGSPSEGSQPVKQDSLSEAATAGVTASAAEAAAIIADITALYDQIEKSLELGRARAQIEALKAALSKVDTQIRLLLQEIDKLQQTEEEEKSRILRSDSGNTERLGKLAALENRLTAVRATVLFRMNTEADTNSAVSWFRRIAKDPAYASRLLDTMRRNANNTFDMTQFLRNDIKGTTIDVREIRNANGLTIVLQIGRRTHCLSTTLQCGGKRYSVSR